MLGFARRMADGRSLRPKKSKRVHASFVRNADGSVTVLFGLILAMLVACMALRSTLPLGFGAEQSR